MLALGPPAKRETVSKDACIFAGSDGDDMKPW